MQEKQRRNGEMALCWPRGWPCIMNDPGHGPILGGQGSFRPPYGLPRRLLPFAGENAPTTAVDA